MKRLRHILIILALAALFTTAFCTAAYAATTDLKIEVTYQQSTARQMLSMINEFRTGSDAWAWNSDDSEKIYYTNLSELQYDYELEKAAMQRAAEIAVLFAHTRPDGTDSSSAGGWGTSSNIYGYTCGENIAGGPSTAKAAFTNLREEDEPYDYQGHRRNMLSENFTAVGIGHVVVNGIHYWVQQFGASPHTTATEPRNETVEMTIPVQESYITSVTLAFRNSGVSSMRIPYRTEHMQIPEVRTAVMLVCPGVYGGESWPSAAQVKADLTWTSTDTGVVEVDGTTLKGIYPGSANVTTSWRGKTLSLGITVTPLNISGYTVTAADAVYTGEALKPEVTVTPPEEGATPLTAGTDYTVIYQNNTDAGTASVQVTGRGPYTGTTGCSFNIAPVDISGGSVTGLNSVTYTGSAQTPDFTLKVNGRTLEEGRDYTASWSGNVNAGTASLVLTGKGNYTGTKETAFTIRPVSLSDYSIPSIDDVTYTGKAQEPLNDIPGLPDGALISFEYTNNTDAGIATVTVSGTHNCTGTLTATFTILPKSISGATVAAEDQVYSGEALTPAVTVTLGGKTLAAEKDYVIPADAYANNVEKGQATVRVTGCGNYTGSAAGTFRIDGISVAKAKTAGDLVVLGDVNEKHELVSRTYTGAAHKPKLVLKYKEETLVEGTDYTRKDSNNINAGEAEIVITGTDRFEDKLVLKYKILAADITAASLKAANYTYSGKENKPVPTVTLDGKKLVLGQDFEIMRYATNVNVGNGAVRIKGIGNYAGEKAVKFKIAKLDLSKAFKLAPIATQYYTGSRVTTKSYTLNRIMEKAAKPVEGTDYTVDWWNNIKVSTAEKPASLVLTAKKSSRNYTGRIKLDFKIVYRPKGTAFNTSAGYFKITKAGPNGTAEAVFVKPKNATAQAQKVPDKVTWQKVTYKVTSVAAGAFKGNKYMTSLTVGSLVKTIGANAFSSCPKLKSVVIGGAVTNIGKQAFYKDGALKAITIRSKLLTAKTVGAEAFKGIYAKAYVKVPAAKVKAYRTILTGRGATSNITVVGA